jgi:hypothetical protein
MSPANRRRDWEGSRENECSNSFPESPIGTEGEGIHIQTRKANGTLRLEKKENTSQCGRERKKESLWKEDNPLEIRKKKWSTWILDSDRECHFTKAAIRGIKAWQTSINVESKTKKKKDKTVEEWHQKS